MDCGREVLNYAAGDHVGVFPGNSHELVMGILKHLPNAPPTNQSVRLEYLPESGPGKHSTKFTRFLSYIIIKQIPGYMQGIMVISKSLVTVYSALNTSRLFCICANLFDRMCGPDAQNAQLLENRLSFRAI